MQGPATGIGIFGPIWCNSLIRVAACVGPSECYKLKFTCGQVSAAGASEMTRNGSYESQGNERKRGLEDESLSHSPGHPDQSKLNKYLEAARSTNTEIATANAIKHYREVYKGPFPCTPHDLSLYLSHYAGTLDRKSTRLNSSHVRISYAVFCSKKPSAIRREARASLS